MPHIEYVKEGQKARWPYDKNEHTEPYVEPSREGYVFIGWKFNDKEPFYPNTENESENPFGPINSNTEIQGILDIPNEIVISVTPNISEIGSEGRTIDVTYYLRTNHDYKVNRNLVFAFIDTDQSWYEEGNVYFVDSTVRRTITILPNTSQEQRAFTFKVSFQNIENEITLIQKTRQESDECQPIVENTTGATALALKMFGVDTEGHVFIGYTSDTYDINYNCGSTLVGVLDKNNTGGLIVQDYRTSIIDEYAIMTKLPKYYGQMVQATYDTTYTIETVNDANKLVTINYHGFVDEDNLILLRGSVANRAIRIPCDGFSGTVSIAQYPYDYSSDSLSNDPKLVFMKLVDGNFSAYGITQDTFTYDGFEGHFESWSNSAIDYNFTYNIQPNDMCDYKLFIVYITNYQSVSDGAINPQGAIYGTQQTDESCVMLQFIQEYDVKNRIYYGQYISNDKYPTNFDDKYNETSSTNYTYNAWFETCSSKTLTQNEFNINLDANTSYYIAYPKNDFDYQVTYEGATISTLRNGYMWGSKSYMLIKVTSGETTTAKITIKKP